MTMLLVSEALRVLERHAQSPQPWDRRAVSIERGFSEDWVVRAFVEPNQEPITLDLHDASGPHEPLVRSFRMNQNPSPYLHCKDIARPRRASQLRASQTGSYTLAVEKSLKTTHTIPRRAQFWKEREY